MPAGELKVYVPPSQTRKSSRSKAKKTSRTSNGRYVISSVRKPVEDKKPAMEVRWINGKRVIGLKK